MDGGLAQMASNRACCPFHLGQMSALEVDSQLIFKRCSSWLLAGNEPKLPSSMSQ